MLSLNQIRKVINELSSVDAEILEISGGEPLMHPDLPQIVRYAERGDLETILYTSGTILSGDVAEKLRQAGLRKVIFNLQGGLPNTHDAVTQAKGSFSHVIDSIKTMKSLNFWVGTHFVPMKLNYREFESFLGLCHVLEVDEIGVLRFVPQGRGQTNRNLLRLSEEEFRGFNLNLTEIASRHSNPNIRVGRPVDFRHLFDSSIVKSRCDAGISRCLITPNGKVLPCPAFKQIERYLAGDIKNSSLIDIWDASPIWRNLRDFDYTQINEPCKSCDYLQQCKGGCIAQRILEYKDIYAAPDPSCFRCATVVAATSSLGTKVREQL
jgi:pyrroloquinoline quinone biosynthesis protein E